MRYLGLGHFTALDLDPVALVRLAGAAGYGFVGLRFVPIFAGHVHYLPETPAALADLRAAMDGEGIALYDVESVVIDEGLAPASLAPALEAAAALGAARLNLQAEDWDRPALVDRVARIAAMAGEVGISVDLEPMAWRGIDTPAKCLEVIAASGAANAGYLVDALHHPRCGGTPGDLAAMDPALIASVQLCDAPSETPATTEDRIAEARGGRLPPGEGGLDVAALIAALPDHATISVEVPMAGAPRPVAERVAHIHRATLALLEGPR